MNVPTLYVYACVANNSRVCESKPRTKWLHWPENKLVLYLKYILLVPLSLTQEDDDSGLGAPEYDTISENGLLSRNEPIRSKVSKLTERLRKRYPTTNTGNCSSCNAVFSVLKKRRNCSNCGNSFCSRCCSFKVLRSFMGATAPEAQRETVFVCSACNISLIKWQWDLVFSSSGQWQVIHCVPVRFTPETMYWRHFCWDTSNILLGWTSLLPLQLHIFIINVAYGTVLCTLSCLNTQCETGPFQSLRFLTEQNGFLIISPLLCRGQD